MTSECLSHVHGREEEILNGIREKSGVCIGEDAVLESYAHWWRYGWNDAVLQYSNPGWHDRKFAANKWERDLPDTKKFIAKFAFTQVLLELPPNISNDGAQRALMTIVPSLPDIYIAQHVMNNRIGEALFFGFKPHEELFQRVFWNTFRQLTPHREVKKILPSLYY